MSVLKKAQDQLSGNRSTEKRLKHLQGGKIFQKFSKDCAFAVPEADGAVELLALFVHHRQSAFPVERRLNDGVKIIKDRRPIQLSLC